MDSGPPFEIRQARLEDWPMIKAFLEDCYGSTAAFKAGPRWLWQFVETPYPPLGKTQVAVWIAVHDGRIAGQLAVQPGQLFLNGDSKAVGWIVDVMVRPEYRGLKLGHKIHDAILASGVVLVTLTMALATRRIAERAGAITLGPVYQMVRVERLSGRTLRDLFQPSVERRQGALRAAGRLFLDSKIGPGAMAAALSALAPRPRLKSRPATLRVQDVEVPSFAEASELFETCLSRYPALFDRGAAFLKWRFQKIPDLKYQWAEARREEELSALAAWRQPDPVELPVGVLADVMARPEDGEAMDAVIETAVSAMKTRTEAIVAGASHPAHVSALRRHGFRIVKTHRPTVAGASAELSALIGAIQTPWHFTKADHDWDQIHPADD
jgi:GNAT superfamily N-acetyltransferase